MKAKGRFTDARKLLAYAKRAIRNGAKTLASSARRIARQKARERP